MKALVRLTFRLWLCDVLDQCVSSQGQEERCVCMGVFARACVCLHIYFYAQSGIISLESVRRDGLKIRGRQRPLRNNRESEVFINMP